MLGEEGKKEIWPTLLLLLADTAQRFPQWIRELHSIYLGHICSPYHLSKAAKDKNKYQKS